MAFTGIILNDGEGSNRVVLYSRPWNSMESGSEGISPEEDYSNIDVALFIGCKTAYDKGDGANLPAVVVSQGAKAAVGFKETIICADANAWTERLYDCLLAGQTLKEAVNEASKGFDEASGLKSVVICGNGNIRIS